MRTRYLLQLDARLLVLQRWQQAGLQELARFSQSATGQADLQTWLNAHPGLSLSLLVNLAEEGFQVETLPHLNGKDRQAVLDRKLNQYFFGTPLTLTQPLGHQKKQRKEERVLLIALTQPTLIEPWLLTLQSCHTLMLGLFSLPQLTGDLCHRLALPLDHCLVLTRHAQGLRQSLVMQGETVFSRLTPLADEHIVSEVQKLHQFLGNQQLINWDAPLAVCLLVHPLQLNNLQTRCSAEQGHLHFKILDICNAATKLGLRTPLCDSLADPLFLHLLATRPPRRQFAPAPLRQAYLRARLRRVLLPGAITLLLAGLLLMGKELANAQHARAEASRMGRESAALQTEYEGLSVHIPGLELDQEQLRTLLNRYDQIAGQRRTPARTLAALSHGLNAAPSAKLEKLHWQATETSSSLIVEGHLNATDPSQLSNDFAQLLAALNQQEIKLQVLHHPVETAPDKPLRGGDLEAAVPLQPPFSLRLQTEANP